MPSLQLSTEEFTATLQRAREIAGVDPSTTAGDDLELYVQAADEVGIPREALLQALQERQSVIGIQVAVGDTVFAPSLDGYWYPAEVLAAAGPTASVRFRSGGEHTCAAADLRSLSLVPGRRLEAKWKDWGWAASRIVSCDPKTGKVVVSDWSGQEAKISVNDLRLEARAAKPESVQAQAALLMPRALAARWGAAAAVAGVLAGAALHHFLPFLFPFLR